MLLVNYEPRFLEFMYQTRCHPAVNEMLTGNPPASFEEHTKFMDKHGGRYYVLLDDDQPVAYSQIKPFHDVTCEVGFVVNPEFQNKGYGNRLIKLTLDRAQEEYCAAVLYVLQNNHRAIHLYNKFGFVPIENRGGEISMSLELDP